MQEDSILVKMFHNRMFVKTHYILFTRSFNKKHEGGKLTPIMHCSALNVLVPTWRSWNADDKDGALML